MKFLTVSRLLPKRRSSYRHQLNPLPRILLCGKKDEVLNRCTEKIVLWYFVILDRFPNEDNEMLIEIKELTCKNPLES